MPSRHKCWGGALLNPVRPLLKGVNNITPILWNLQKVECLTQGHMGTKWQGRIRTRECGLRGLTPAVHHQAASGGGPGTPPATWHEEGGAPWRDGSEKGQEASCRGAGRIRTGSRDPSFAFLVYLPDPSEPTRDLPWEAPPDAPALLGCVSPGAQPPSAHGLCLSEMNSVLFAP